MAAAPGPRQWLHSSKVFTGSTSRTSSWNTPCQWSSPSGGGAMPTGAGGAPSSSIRRKNR